MSTPDLYSLERHAIETLPYLDLLAIETDESYDAATRTKVSMELGLRRLNAGGEDN